MSNCNCGDEFEYSEHLKKNSSEFQNTIMFHPTTAEEYVAKTREEYLEYKNKGYKTKQVKPALVQPSQ